MVSTFKFIRRDAGRKARIWLANRVHEIHKVEAAKYVEMRLAVCCMQANVNSVYVISVVNLGMEKNRKLRQLDCRLV